MKNDFLGWRASDYNANNYINSINKFLSSEQLFSNFRQPDEGYNAILEHVNIQQAEIYSKTIKNLYPNLLSKIEKFKKNDLIGNPLFFYDNDFGPISPTTLRYIKFAGDIQFNFQDLNDFHLIEIGGGYGGLVRILTDIFNFKSITMVDLKQPLNLQEKYLNKFDIKIIKKTIEEDFEIEKNTLIISNYAWCECDAKTRKEYLNKIINKCKYAFMAIHDVNVQHLIDELKSEDSNASFIKDVVCETPIYIKK